MATRTSTMAAPPAHRRARALLAVGLVVLAAAIVGAALAFGRLAQAPTPAAPTAAPRPMIATCRVCADEALAARQPAAFVGAAIPAPAPALAQSAAPARPLIAGCQACRDEALGAAAPTYSAEGLPAALDGPALPGGHGSRQTPH